eukprot:4596160-Amphidinium_carterae.1
MNATGVHWKIKNETQIDDVKRRLPDKKPEHVKRGFGGVICVLVDDVFGGGRGNTFQTALVQSTL